MKLLTFLGFLLISSSAVFAQEIDERLLTRYAKEDLQKMIETDVDQYNLLD